MLIIPVLPVEPSLKTSSPLLELFPRYIPPLPWTVREPLKLGLLLKLRIPQDPPVLVLMVVPVLRIFPIPLGQVMFV